MRTLLQPVIVLVAACLVSLSAGCQQKPDPIAHAIATAGGPGGRKAAASELAGLVTSHQRTYDEVIIFATRVLEADAAGQPMSFDNSYPTPAALTAFAGAVLDAGVSVEGSLNSSDMAEPFWWRVGNVAYLAANAALNDHRPQDARAVVLAGPQRWQSSSYWNSHQDHDALTSIILAMSGEREAALRRLETHNAVNMDSGPVREVYDKLKSGK